MKGIDFREVQTMPPVLVKLTHSEKKMMRWNRSFGGSDESLQEVLGRSEACANTYVHEDGATVHIVFMRPSLERAADVDAALLAHEATHVVQEHFRSLGEARPSDELQAYAVQYVTQYLVSEHFAWKKKQFDKR